MRVRECKERKRKGNIGFKREKIVHPASRIAHDGVDAHSVNYSQ